MIKKIALVIFISSSSIGLLAQEYPQAFFNRDCERAISKEISMAKKEIYLAVYSFTRYSIAGALSRAAEKGLAVHVILDEKQKERNEHTEKIIKIMLEGGVNVYTVNKADTSSMHHKFLIADDSRIVTGSFNYTTSASKFNSENIIIIDNKSLKDKFKKEWLEIKKLSKAQKKPQN